MKYGSKWLFIVCLLINIWGCQGYQNVIVNGKVIDRLTKEPIPNAEVIVVCWYYTGLEEETYRKVLTKTDENGLYHARVGRGHKVEVAAKFESYIPLRSRNKLNQSKLLIDFELEKSGKLDSVVANLITSDVLMKTERIPFLRQRVYSNKETKELDFSSTEVWGYDFFSSKNTNNPASIDIYLEPTGYGGFSEILKASEKGGILPVFPTDIKSYFLFDQSEAPISGYKKEYRLQGNEAGFFIKCRDGQHYAKLIIEKSKLSRSVPHNEGFYKEWGYKFTSVFQPNSSRRLGFYFDIDLESFLIDSRYF